MTHGEKTFTGETGSEGETAGKLLQIMYQLPVIPVRPEGDVPGFMEHGDNLYHPHTVREAFARIVGRQALYTAKGAS